MSFIDAEGTGQDHPEITHNATRIIKEEDFRLLQQEYEEMKATLKVLLKQREKEKDEYEGKILLDIKNHILPCVNKLRKGQLDSDGVAHINILETHLNNIMSSFSDKMTSKYLNMTHKELQVAIFIKAGKSTKEIAHLMNVSIRAIDIHRYNIRRKLGLNKKRVNLYFHLNSL